MNQTSREPIGVGIVGYGFAGRGFHAYLIDQEPALKVRGVFVRSPERRALAGADRDVTVYDSLEAMLADPGIELVVLATPHDVHAEQTIAAANAGKHVVTDKVVSLNAAEARAMAEAADRNHVLLSVFHNRRWDGDFMTIRKAWESGLLGEVYAAECCVMGCGGPRGWRGKKAHSGGVLFDWGAHLLDQALLLGGEPKAVTAWVADMRAWPESDIGNYGKVVIQFRSGLLYGVETGNLSRIPKPHWWIQGTKGALRKEGVDPQEAAMLKGDIGAAREDPANRAFVRTEISGQMEELRLETERGDWREFYKNVAAAIRGEADLAVTPTQMTTLMSVYDAAMESVATGRTVAL